MNQRHSCAPYQSRATVLTPRHFTSFRRCFSLAGGCVVLRARLFSPDKGVKGPPRHPTPGRPARPNTQHPVSWPSPTPNTLANSPTPSPLCGPNTQHPPLRLYISGSTQSDITVGREKTTLATRPLKCLKYCRSTTGEKYYNKRITRRLSQCSH